MMKQIYLFIFLIGFITCSQAQVEFSNKFKGIPPVNTKPKLEKKDIPPTDPNVPVIIPPNVYKSPTIIQSPPNPVDDYKVKIKSEMSMIPKNEFINPGDQVRERLNNNSVQPHPNQIAINILGISVQYICRIRSRFISA